MSYPEFEKFYEDRKSKPPWDHPHNPVGFPAEQLNHSSDISAHLPMLEYLARQVYSVTEFGTRGCYSTSAFIAGAKGKVKSYDLHWNKDIDYLYDLGQKDKLPSGWFFEQGDTLKVAPIKNTDLLFIDTLHTYAQVKGELNRHSGNVNRFIAFHDTSIYSQGNISVDRPEEDGILKAIDEFVNNHPLWRKVYEVQFNHGLIVLEKF